MKKSNIDSPYCLECYTELHYYINEPRENYDSDFKEKSETKIPH